MAKAEIKMKMVKVKEKVMKVENQTSIVSVMVDTMDITDIILITSMAIKHTIPKTLTIQEIGGVI